MNWFEGATRAKSTGAWRVYVPLVALLMGCGASAQKPAIETAISDDKLRGQAFEATLRILDEHPEYVDEFFVNALRHPRTLDRLLQNTAKQLEQDDFARMTARRLAEQPNGLKQTMIATLDAISDKPASLEAVAVAMRERPKIAAMVLVQREDAMRATVKALVREASGNAEGRRALLLAIQDNSYPMAALIAQDAKVTASMFRAFGKVGLEKGKNELNALVKAIGSESD